MLSTRRAVQGGFLALVLVGVFVFRANCELWCPFGGVEALYTYLHEGNLLCSLGTANFFILGGVLLMTLLVRRAFCGYACPIGTISEWLHGIARRLKLPQGRVTGRLDRGLAALKYALLVVILGLTWPAGELIFRGFDPCYALISRHGPDITAWAYVTAGAVVVASLFVMLPFCRWFCPLAAVLNPVSRFSLTRVRRDADTCRDCGRCANRCPAALPVDRSSEVTAARCIACWQCVDACPQRAGRALSWGPPKPLRTAWPQIAIVLTVIACTTAAAAASYLFPLPSFVKTRGRPPAQVSRVELGVTGLACRGNANMFVYFLERDDMFSVPGYLQVEAWPDQELARVRVSFDPSQADADRIRQAIVEPYFDVAAESWRTSPFTIDGYDPLGELPATTP